MTELSDSLQETIRVAAREAIEEFGSLLLAELDDLLETDPRNLVSVRTLAAKTEISESAIRKQIQRSSRNGLKGSGALVYNGRKPLINLRKYVRWLESR